MCTHPGITVNQNTASWSFCLQIIFHYFCLFEVVVAVIKIVVGLDLAM